MFRKEMSAFGTSASAAPVAGAGWGDFEKNAIGCLNLSCQKYEDSTVRRGAVSIRFSLYGFRSLSPAANARTVPQPRSIVSRGIVRNTFCSGVTANSRFVFVGGQLRPGRGTMGIDIEARKLGCRTVE
jgi:hypothetical protein